MTVETLDPPLLSAVVAEPSERLVPAPERATPVDAGDVIVGCVVDNALRFEQQALRLVQSIRWFGGGLAQARLLVCAVDSITDRVRGELESLGAEVRIVSRFHPANGSSNRLRFFDELGEEERAVLLLDCDTLVVRDPLPLLSPGGLLARIAPLPTVTHEVLARLFEHYGIPLPPRSHRTGWTGTPTIPYFNAGVLFLPAALARRLAPIWGRFNRELADRPELVYPCQKHLHQASLSLALAAGDIPCEEAPFELHYQLNLTHLEPPEGFLTLDPAILHYHDRVDGEGYLQPTPYPLARLRAEMFNQRLREERGASRARAARRPASPGAIPQAAQVAVLGMHRAGSSAVTRLLNLAGLAAGPEERFPIPDLANPTGYWENSDVVLLDDALLAALGATWSEPADDLDFGRLPLPQRQAFEARARGLIQGFDTQGPWLVKDPRLCLLFPFWRRLLARPVCVLIYRDPLPVARSLADRDGLEIPLGLALWELYLRSALAGSRGLPRVLVSYHELMAAPRTALRRLLTELEGLGVPGLRMPEGAAIDAFLDADLDRHPRDPATQRAYLTPPQLELWSDLTSGAALDLDPVPPLSPGARDTLAAHRRRSAERRRLRASLDHRDVVITQAEARKALELSQLDELFAATFASRSWRLGHAASRLLRPLKGESGPTALERWESLRRART